MGQLESCLRDGKENDLQGPLDQEQPASFSIRPVTLLQGGSQEPVEANLSSQQSSLLAKLRHYDKGELAKMLISDPLPQVHTKSLHKQLRRDRGSPPSFESSGYSKRQYQQMKQLEALRQECLRIDSLRSELVRKSRRMQEQQGRKNQVHGHQSFFASTHKPQSPSASPRQ